MGIVMTALFKSVTLHATEENVALVERADFSRIGRYILKITFLASPFALDVTVEDLKDALLAFEIHKGVEKRGNVRPGESRSFCMCHRRCDYMCELRMRNTIKEYSTSTSRSEWQTRLVHHWYSFFARKDQEVIGSGRLQRAWLAVTTYASNVSTCRVDSTVDEFETSRVGRCDTFYAPNCDDYCVAKQVFRRSRAENSAATFDVAVACLGSCRVRIQHFDVEAFGFTNLKNGYGLSQWDQLNLQAVTTFNYRCMQDNRPADDADSPLSWDEDASSLARAGLELVLKKCHGTLQHLSLDHGSPVNYLFWDSFGLEFPALRSIELSDPTCRQEILGALRQHPNPIRFTMEDATGDADPINVKFDPKADYTLRVEPQVGELTIGMRVCLYLSKHIDWDDTLDNAFLDS
ncbi:hypothetical protein H2200_004581 [Cladophialophora chaetospira]|uniref:Uncharacterized protein n=1 Tax=Cladophialophora chaetospira TaxID=386627 RepID=A0AA38XDG4_9EURO|nr:hypothetical protein H2200_004581 [Cladophialophora chaetospira]